MKKLIKVKKSPIHGRGVFAKVKIRKGTHIGNYEGPETMKDGTYVLWCYDEDDKLFGIKGKNDLRYCNHSSKPNAVFMGEELHAIKKIQKGEEVCFDYGEDWKSVK